MEKAPGIQLFRKWDDLDGDIRLSIIKQLTELENELASISFPASGHLYFKESISENNRKNLDSSIDPTSKYCIGRSCDRSWNIDQSQPVSNGLKPGPCKYLLLFHNFIALIAVAQGTHLLRTVERLRTEKYSNFRLKQVLDLIDCTMPKLKTI